MHSTRGAGRTACCSGPRAQPPSPPAQSCRSCSARQRLRARGRVGVPPRARGGPPGGPAPRRPAPGAPGATHMPAGSPACAVTTLHQSRSPDLGGARHCDVVYVSANARGKAEMLACAVTIFKKLPKAVLKAHAVSKAIRTSSRPDRAVPTQYVLAHIAGIQCHVLRRPQLQLFLQQMHGVPHFITVLCISSGMALAIDCSQILHLPEPACAPGRRPAQPRAAASALPDPPSTA